MSNEGYLKIQTCVLKVNIHCEDCKRKVKKILHEIEGVYITKIDVDLKKVTVFGNVDPTTLIKALVKKGKRAEIWDIENPLTNMTKNLQIDSDNKGEKKKKKEEGNARNQSKGRVGGGHSQHPCLNPQQKLQLKLWKKMQQQMTQLIPMPMPIIKKQNQMQKQHKAVRFNIPMETNEDETSDGNEEDVDYFPQQLPFNKMNTSTPMMKFNYQQFRNYDKSDQGNVSGRKNGNQNQVGRWYNDNFTRVQNFGNGYYPPNMTQISNMPMGHGPLVMSDNNPYYQQQQQQLAVGMMNQHPSFGNERFQQRMYMSHPYPQPSYPYMYAMNDENTSSCNMM